MTAEALELVQVTLRDVAEWVGVPYATVRAWRVGVRSIPTPHKRALAKALRAHAKRLDRMAARLERDADRATP